MSYLKEMLAESEEIALISGRHWTAIAKSLLLTGLVCLVLVAVGVFMMVRNDSLRLPGLFIACLSAFPLIKLIYDYMQWRSSKFVITSLRVLQISGILNKHVSDSNLEKLNDVIMRQSFVGRIFGYGDLEILTASGEEGTNHFSHISDPVKFKTTMLNQKRSQEEQMVSVTSVAPDIPSQIAGLADLRDRGIISHDEFTAKKADLLRRM